jgi:RHS repeat-associated protein
MGSVRSVSNGYGGIEERYEYDAFGMPYRGDLTGGMNLGYTGKPYDTTTGLYNYGYRDYSPALARFTTVDPIRDGANWFAYVNNDPVNWIDPDGEIPVLVGAAVGFVFSSASEIGGRMANGQSFSEAVSNTIRDSVSVMNIITSTAIGALTSGASSLFTNGMTQAGKVAVTNIAVNTVGGAADAALKDRLGRSVTGQSQDFEATIIATGIGAASAFVFSGITEAAIASNTTRISQVANLYIGTEKNVQINPPAWNGTAGIIGENVIPTVVDIMTGRTTQGEKNH